MIIKQKHRKSKTIKTQFNSLIERAKELELRCNRDIIDFIENKIFDELRIDNKIYYITN